MFGITGRSPSRPSWHPAAPNPSRGLYPAHLRPKHEGARIRPLSAGVARQKEGPGVSRRVRCRTAGWRSAVDQAPDRATPRRPLSLLRDFLDGEAASGIVLMAVAVLALIVANSPLAPTYDTALKTHVLGLSVLHWINDGLMAVFFLLVGLEIKREMLDGQLSTWRRRILPGIAALGGMIVPALIYIAINAGTPDTLRGWAIPAATDIAFALGVLALLGSRVPPSLKIFLAALAILDD